LSEAPAIFGLRLGLSFEGVQAALPTIKIKPKKNGEGSFFQNFVEQPAPPNLAGVRALFLRFFNNKVYQIEIFYDDKDRAIKLEDFTNQLSTDLNMPTEAWTIKNGQAKIDCGDFLVTADTVLNRHIELTDDAARAEFMKKQQKEKGAKKKKQR
jgi:hypothetical protein